MEEEKQNVNGRHITPTLSSSENQGTNSNLSLIQQQPGQFVLNTFFWNTKKLSI